MSASRLSSTRGRRRSIIVLALGILAVAYFRNTLFVTYNLLSLPVTWGIGAKDFLLDREKDDFDITFSNYSTTPRIVNWDVEEHPNLIPQILHHIRLGSSEPKAEWQEARNACLNMHPDWEAMSWTDANAREFVAENYPHLLRMWESYKFPIQRVDALRYMVLYHYGGVILDMDLHCLRPLSPLLRFPFLAPAAHPIGFSNGFLMAKKEHPFVGSLIDNLSAYNKNWFGLPYATVMFSTGCHYASTIHALQPSSSRAQLKILGGTATNPSLHALNGNVTTPLFHHLGASSWHSFDAFLIVSLGHIGARGWSAILGLVAMFAGSIWGIVRWFKGRRSMRRRASRGSLGLDESKELEEGGGERKGF